MGFEPTRRLTAYTVSNGAPSTTRTPLQILDQEFNNTLQDERELFHRYIQRPYSMALFNSTHV